MTTWLQNNHLGRSPSEDADALRQQLDRLADVNWRLTSDCLILRQKLDTLMDQSAEETIRRLKQTIEALTTANADLTAQLERQQAAHDQGMAGLQNEVRSLQALVAHQYAQLKHAFRAGMFQTSDSQD